MQTLGSIFALPLLIYVVGHKNMPTSFCLRLHQIFTDFNNFLLVHSVENLQ